jgi:hypothetical protein
MLAQIDDSEKGVNVPRRRSWTWVELMAAVLVGLLMAGSAMASSGTRDRCTAFTPESTAKSQSMNVQWQFRLCSADDTHAAQLRFHNPTTKPLVFSYRLFTDEQHACETASDLSSVMTGSTMLKAGESTVWPFPTVRLPEEEYRGRLWLCVFEAK